MKRSEMAKIIGDYFRDTDVSDIDTEDGSYYHGRILLAVLEDAGMLPPAKDYISPNGTVHVRVNKWEDE